MEPNKGRLIYIDCLRGFSMIFVIYQHILSFAMPDAPRSWFAILVWTFRMPLFFFISGFVSYKALFEWNLTNFGKIQMKKIRGQLLPTIVMFFLFVTLHDQNYHSWIFNLSKAGYWFTLVSFEIFLTYCVLNMCVSKFNSKNITLSILALSAIIIAVCYDLKWFPKGKVNLLFSIEYFFQYYMFFIAGILAKSKLEVFHKLIENKWITTIVFIFAFVLPYIFPMIKEITILSRLWCIYSIFYYARNYFEEKNILSKGLSLIGRHTLEIYFLHYFVLFRMPHLQTLLQEIATTGNCFCGPGAEWVMEILIIGSVSTALCLACIGIRKIIDAFPIVSELCFGPQKKNTTKISA